MKKQILTSDGSHSYYLPELDEHYHSKHGAIQESQHVFIESGMNYVATKKEEIRVLELGMGTGLNLYLTALFANQQQIKIVMDSLEPFPLSLIEAKSLNYPEILGSSRTDFELIHQLSWQKRHQMGDFFKWQKIKQKWENFELTASYDLIYYDAFAPDKQAEMWELPLLKKAFSALCSSGVLVTYCVKGIVRRRLKEVGFEVKKLPGPPNGKREILRAEKN